MRNDILEIAKNVVEKHYNSNVDMSSRTRKEKVMKLKRAIIWLLYPIYGPTAIGRMINRNHASVINNYESVRDMMAVDKKYYDKMMDMANTFMNCMRSYYTAKAMSVRTVRHKRIKPLKESELNY